MNLSTALGALAGAVLFASGASAMPAGAGLHQAGPGSGYVTQVAQGCGPGGFRGPGGRCAYSRPGYGARRYAPPPRRYGPPRPACFVKHTPWGPRRVCR